MAKKKSKTSDESSKPGFELREVLRATIRGRNLSGVSWCHRSNTLLAIRNRPPQLVEIGMDGRLIRHGPTYELSDAEDIVVYGESDDEIQAYVVEEDKRRLALLAIRRRDLSTRSIWRWKLPVDAARNKGPEGVSIDWIRGEIVVVYERPPLHLRASLEAVDPLLRGAGSPELVPASQTRIEGIDDASAVLVSTRHGALVLSDESGCVLRLADGARAAHGLAQAEGLTEDGDGRLWICGEPGELACFEVVA